MVTRLDRPIVNDDVYLDAVVAERADGINHGHFQRLQPYWKQRVNDYIASQGNPEQVAPWPGIEVHKVKLQSLYLNRQEGSTQKPVIDTLADHNLQYCPACGEDGRPNTLDHHLPKDSYPEFSITPSNLFPMCDICQRKKGTATVDEAGLRYFIHPYFDDFASQQVIAIEILPPFHQPTIEVRAHGGLAPDDFALASRHLAKLEIPQRFYRYFRQEYGRLLRLVEDLRATAAPVPAALGVFHVHARRKAINSWDHVWYSGVLANEPLLHYLAHEELPPYL